MKQYALLIAISLLLPTRLIAAVPEVMFILDSSGSMAGKVGTDTKIDAARRVMREIVPAIPAEVAVGLTVYGHRRPGDCSDIEMIATPGQTDRQKILEQIEKMKPVGKTPLSRSILQVAAGIRLHDAETTIILVSDGIDTCGGDPCKVVAELKKSGLNFVLHTVGLDVESKAEQQLQCMAKAGGGRYFQAGDAASLLEALRTVTVEIAGKTAAAKAAFVQAGSGLGKLRLALPTNAEKSLKQLQIVRKKDGSIVKEVGGVKPDSLHPLLSGEYLVRLSFAQPNYGDPIWTELGEVAITKGQTRELILGSISFDVPKEIADAAWETGLNIDTVEIVNAGTDQAVATVHDNNNGYYNFKPKPVLPGIYDVRLTYATETPSATVVARDVMVQAGKDAVVTLNTGIRLTGNLAEVSGWNLTPRNQQIADEAEDGSQPLPKSPLLTVRNKTGAGGNRHIVGYTYLIPAGTYDLHVLLQGMTEPLPVAEKLVIESGAVLEFDPGL